MVLDKHHQPLFKPCTFKIINSSTVHVDIEKLLVIHAMFYYIVFLQEKNVSDYFFLCLLDLTRAVNALPRNVTSQMFNAIAAVTGQGQNPNTTPAQWASSQYGYSGGSSAGGGGGSSSAYHVCISYSV